MNEILTKDEEIYEIARDFCRLNCSCEECSLVGTRNRDNCKAKVYARRAYEKGYKKRDSVPINFTFTEEQIRKMTEDIKERFEPDIKAIRSEVAREMIEDIKRIGGCSEGIRLNIWDIADLEKKYTEGYLLGRM